MGPFIFFVHISRNPQAGGLLFELKIKGGTHRGTKTSYYQ